MKCPGCPVGRGDLCRGESGRLPHFCVWAASGEPGKLMLIADVSRLPDPDQGPGPPLPPDPAPDPGRFSGADGVPCAWRFEVQACCGPVDVCRAPGHPNEGLRVMTAQCLACVSAGLRPVARNLGSL